MTRSSLVAHLHYVLFGGAVFPLFGAFYYWFPKRGYIGGVLSNSADNLVQWIHDPHKFSPQSVMPKTGISEEEAKHVAAYLYVH